MRALQCLSLAFLFLVSAVPSKAQGPAAAPASTEAPADDFGVVPDLLKFQLGYHFELNCTELLAQPPADIIWKKNSTEVEKVLDLAGRYATEGSVFKLTARATEDDYGNYSCHMRGASGAVKVWQVQAIPHAKLPDNTNVVQGQKLKLQCKVIGKPHPSVTWTFKNSTDELNSTDVATALGGRAILQRSEQGVENGELIIEAAERTDAGVFTCTAGTSSDSTTLRVKDMYAALWPFLGICIEVFILCAIILVYEKRRTKPELDDSDTDNHDQKKS